MAGTNCPTVLFLSMAVSCTSVLLRQEAGIAQEDRKIASPVATIRFGEPGAGYERYQMRGLAFAKDHLWLLGKTENALYRYDPAARKILAKLPAPCKDPRGLSWDGSSLLVSDQKTHVVYQVEPVGGTSKELLDLDKCEAVEKLPVMPRDLPSLTAIASDGKHLWAAFAAGYSSSVFKVDLQKRRIVGQMWAHGPEPEGLHLDGDRLVCIDGRNGEIRRLDARGKAVEVTRIPTKSARGLTYDGSGYWYFNPEENQLIKLDLRK